MRFRLEVIRADDLKHGNYRFGDHSLSLLGLSELWPYVEVTFGSRTRFSQHVKATSGTAVFGWTRYFKYDGFGQYCKFRVFDKKGVQATLRGDPLIGEAILPIAESAPQEGLLATFTLRNGGASAGRLTVRYKVTQSEDTESGLLGTAFGDTVRATSVEELMPGQSLLVTGDMPSGACALPACNVQNVGVGRGHDSAVSSDSCFGTPKAWTYQKAILTEVAGSTNAEVSVTRSESSDSFYSALEDPESDLETPAIPAERANISSVDAIVHSVSVKNLAPADSSPRTLHLRRCENVAETYIHAREQNNVSLLLSLFANNAVVAVPTLWGGVSTHRGLTNIETYFKDNPATPDIFRNWSHVGSDAMSGSGDSSATCVAQWSGEVYKFGAWRKLQADFAIDSDALITRVDLLRQ